MFEPAIQHVLRAAMNKLGIADDRYNNAFSDGVFLLLKAFIESKMVDKFHSSFAEHLYGVNDIIRQS